MRLRKIESPTQNVTRIQPPKQNTIRNDCDRKIPDILSNPTTTMSKQRFPVGKIPLLPARPNHAQYPRCPAGSINLGMGSPLSRRCQLSADTHRFLGLVFAFLPREAALRLRGGAYWQSRFLSDIGGPLCKNRLTVMATIERMSGFIAARTAFLRLIDRNRDPSDTLIYEASLQSATIITQSKAGAKGAGGVDWTGKNCDFRFFFLGSASAQAHLLYLVDSTLP